ncbi:hypothetical protein NOJ28_02230 [Neorhizobium galegae]|uniref:hypothetical protein n=1 Tax=Neorhizobium galegae TaxID=399 RepID=UPI00062260FE|nr:hypothetical protein [Neorhizobium galegae]MCQ1764334.1 hypothetical protein [Neorhizobium galegae]MCQ1845961.1 hypothetical protein [Neorhizobium galegae]CDZ41045.1 Hypothetical protein NGAL_HAMBI1146_41780 [Neorhizobium galegae bv. officinalis]
MSYRFWSCLLVSLLAIAPAHAETLAFPVQSQPLQLAQSPSVTIGPNGVIIRRDDDRDRYRDGDRDRDRDRDRNRPRPQRYVCVVSPPPSMDRRRPYVCNAEPGRVGGRCRCSGVVGSGTLDLDR